MVLQILKLIGKMVELRYTAVKELEKNEECAKFGREIVEKGLWRACTELTESRMDYMLQELDDDKAIFYV